MNVVKIMFFTMLSVFLLSSSFATNESTEDNSESQIRILNFQEKLIEHIERAQEIKESVEAENKSADLLDELIARFEAVLSNIESQNLDELSTQEISELFENSKKEVIDATKEFKEESRAKITEDRREQIKQRAEERVKRLQEKKDARIEALKAKKEIKQKEVVLKRVDVLVQKTNLTQIEEVVKQFESNTISKDELISQVKEILKENEVKIPKEKVEQFKEQREEKKAENQQKRVEKKAEKEEQREVKKDEIVEKARSLSTEQKAKIQELIGKNLDELSDEEIVELYVKYKPVIDRYVAQGGEN